MLLKLSLFLPFQKTFFCEKMEAGTVGDISKEGGKAMFTSERHEAKRLWIRRTCALHTEQGCLSLTAPEQVGLLLLDWEQAPSQLRSGPYLCSRPHGAIPLCICHCLQSNAPKTPQIKQSIAWNRIKAFKIKVNDMIWHKRRQSEFQVSGKTERNILDKIHKLSIAFWLPVRLFPVLL